MNGRVFFPLFCLFLTACVAYGAPSAELDDALLIWHNWPAPESQLLDEIIERFVDTHPRVQITTEYVPSHQFDKRFIDRASSGLDPDLVIGLEPHLLYELSEEELLRDLDGMSLKTEGLLPEAITSLRSDGEQVGIPFAAYTNVLFYNKTQVDQPAQTLDELAEAAGNGTRVALPIDFYHAYWGIHAFGGEIIGPDGEIIEDNAFSTWLHWLDEAQNEPTILLNHIYEDLYQTFASGEAAYLVGNSFDLPYLEDALGEGNVGVANLPGIIPGTGPGSILEVETMAISANASEPQALLAAELINFFVNPSQQRRIALSNYGQIPLHQSVSFDERLVPVTAVLIEQGKRSNLFPLDFTKKLDYLRLIGTDTYIQVLEGVVSPQEGVEQLITQMNQGEIPDNIGNLITAQFYTIEHAELTEDAVDTTLLIDVYRKASIYLNRDIVQLQLFAIMGGLFFAWLISDMFWFTIPRLLAFSRKRLMPSQSRSNRFAKLTYRFNSRISGLPTYIKHHLNIDERGERATSPFLVIVQTIGRLIYRLIEAATFPILGFFMLIWIRTWLLENGALGGLLLKMEWVFGAILVYSLVSVFLLEMMDTNKARAAINRYLRPAFFTGLGLAILHNLADILMVAEIILTTLFNSPVTVRALFLSTIGLYLWVGFARIVQDTLYHLITTFTSQEPGSVKATLTLIRYILIIVGIGYLFTQFDFDTTTMAAITGGLSVGIGFALREILGNFISGFMLLFERTLHPGDVIEVDNQISVVENFSIRATTVRTRNNEEMIIPNQTFFTSSFKTLTGTDSKVRVGMTVQTDCNINPYEVIELLKAAGAGHPRVLNDPAPNAILLDYGNNVATFKLNIWTLEAMRSAGIVSDVKLAIWDALKEHKVSFAIPRN